MIEFLARGKGGVELYRGEIRTIETLNQCDGFEKRELLKETTKQCRFNSLDGSRLAYSLNDSVTVLDSSCSGAYREICRVPVPNCADFALSPKGTYLATFEKPRTPSSLRLHYVNGAI